MKPLLDFRNELATQHDTRSQAAVRVSYKCCDGGRVSRKADGTLKSPGPYRLQARQDLLLKLLQIIGRSILEGPILMRRSSPSTDLEEIRRIWPHRGTGLGRLLPRICLMVYRC